MRRGPFLVDTGFVVALLNAADPAHPACQRTWKDVQGPFVSTEGVLVEAAWLLCKVPGAFPNAMKVLRAVGTVFVAPTAHRYQRALELMEQYRDTPMDFVDALLVACADEFDVRRVLTLDRRGFGAYRQAGARFQLLP